MAILAFRKFSFDFRPLPAGLTRASRSRLAANNAGGHPHRGQVVMVGLAVIGLISRGFPGAAVYQDGELRAVVHIARSGLDSDNKLRIGVLHLMNLIAIERLLLALAAKTGAGSGEFRST